VFSFPSVAKRPKGVIVLTFAGLPSGKLSVRATFKHKTSVIKEVDGQRRRVTVDKTLTYATATRTLLAAGTATLTLDPTKRALTALARHGHDAHKDDHGHYQTPRQEAPPLGGRHRFCHT
jgi:hypothetical protein